MDPVPDSTVGAQFTDPESRIVIIATILHSVRHPSESSNLHFSIHVMS